MKKWLIRAGAGNGLGDGKTVMNNNNTSKITIFIVPLETIREGW